MTQIYTAGNRSNLWAANLEQLDSHFLTKDAKKKHKIGQLFDTYWLIEYEDSSLSSGDTTHEKSTYRRTMKRFQKTFTPQTISPWYPDIESRMRCSTGNLWSAALVFLWWERICNFCRFRQILQISTWKPCLLKCWMIFRLKRAPNLIMEKVASHVL